MDWRARFQFENILACPTTEFKMCNWIYTITRCCYCNAESITNFSKLDCNLLAELVSFYNEIGGAEPDDADCHWVSTSALIKLSSISAVGALVSRR
jgi:hypothetical protein